MGSLAPRRALRTHRIRSVSSLVVRVGVPGGLLASLLVPRPVEPQTLAPRHPPPEVTEPEPPPLATLALWAEGVWLSATDRDGSYRGRLAYEGTFQRFHPLMDPEYGMDVWTGLFSQSEDARWAQAPRGLRAAAASINEPFIMNVAELRERIPVGGPVALEFRYFREHSLTARRDYPRVALHWLNVLGSPWTLGSSVGMHAFKASADVEVFLARRWQVGAESWWDVQAGLTFLDLFNDVVFVGLGVEPRLAETQFDYRGVPLGARAALTRATAGGRLEVHCGTTARTHVEVSFPGTGELPYSLAERVSYAGLLAQWTVSRASAVAAYATFARAETERSVSFAGRPELDLREETRTVGVRARARVGPALWLEADLSGAWRPEDRFTRAGGFVTHEDREYAGQVALTRRPAAGWLWLLAAAAMDREAGALARRLTADNRRQIMEWGYRFASGFEVVAGVRWDMDDFARHPFDGGHLRFSAAW